MDRLGLPHLSSVSPLGKGAKSDNEDDRTKRQRNMAGNESPNVIRREEEAADVIKKPKGLSAGDGWRESGAASGETASRQVVRTHRKNRNLNNDHAEEQSWECLDLSKR